jgi:hypothetical protein
VYYLSTFAIMTSSWANDPYFRFDLTPCEIIQEATRQWDLCDITRTSPKHMEKTFANKQAGYTLEYHRCFMLAWYEARQEWQAASSSFSLPTLYQQQGRTLWDFTVDKIAFEWPMRHELYHAAYVHRMPRSDNQVRGSSSAAYRNLEHDSHRGFLPGPLGLRIM